jgi:hypothetical protein
VVFKKVVLFGLSVLLLTIGHYSVASAQTHYIQRIDADVELSDEWEIADSYATEQWQDYFDMFEASEMKKISFVAMRSHENNLYSIIFFDAKDQKKAAVEFGSLDVLSESAINSLIEDFGQMIGSSNVEIINTNNTICIVGYSMDVQGHHFAQSLMYFNGSSSASTLITSSTDVIPQKILGEYTMMLTGLTFSKEAVGSNEAKNMPFVSSSQKKTGIFENFVQYAKRIGRYIMDVWVSGIAFQIILVVIGLVFIGVGAVIKYSISRLRRKKLDRHNTDNHG